MHFIAGWPPQLNSALTAFSAHAAHAAHATTHTPHHDKPQSDEEQSWSHSSRETCPVNTVLVLHGHEIVARNPSCKACCSEAYS